MYDSQKRILLVEDEAIVALNEKTFLESEGYSVDIVCDGESAVAAACSGDFDLVLMDIELGPGIDGAEAAIRIIADCGLPVVFISSHTEAEIVKKTEGIDSYGYIVKNSGDNVLSVSISTAFRLCCANEELQDRERELNWEKNRLKQYLNVAEVVLMVIGTDRKIKLINRKGCKILGYDEAEILGKNWFENFTLADNTEEMEDVFDNIIKGNIENTEYYENKIICRNNRIRLIAWHNSLLRNSDGKISGVITSGEDITEMREYETKLKKSRDDFYQLFYGMKDAAAIYKPDESCENFFIADLNKAGQLSFGVDVKQIKGKNLRDEFLFTGDIGLISLLKKVCRTGKAGFLPRTSYLENGIERWLEFYVFRLPSGMLVTVFKDQNINVELERSEERLRIVNELGSDYSYCHRFNPDGSLEPVWNIGSFAKITGYSPSELFDIGGWQKLIHPDDIAGAKDYIAELVSGKESSITARIVTKSGECRWIRDAGRPWFDDEDRVIGAYGYATDITEQKDLADRLLESEQKYRALYMNAPLPYQSLDGAGDFIDVNPEWLRTLGYEKDDVLGHNFTEFLHPDWIAHFKTNFPLLKEKGAVHDAYFRIRRKDGRYLDILFEGCIGYNSDGSFRQSYCVFKDVTEQKKAEKDNLLLMDELNHRVKNNLQMVLALLKLKDGELAENADLSDLIHQVESITLIHKHLAETPYIGTVKLDKYIKELLESIFSSAVRSDIELFIDIGAIELPTRQLVALGLVVNEIATNAIKYGFNDEVPARFSLEQLSDDEAADVVISASNSGNRFPEELDFESSGGLGLKLMKTLITQLGGSIDIKRDPLTSFIISIPK